MMELFYDNIGRKVGIPSTILLWVLQRPYKTPVFEPVESNLLETLSENILLFFKFFEKFNNFIFYVK